MANVTPRFKAEAPKRRELSPRVDKAHQAWIRTLPCIVSLTPDRSVCHHLLRKAERGAGLRAPDWYTVPLRGDLHDLLHREVPADMSEEEWLHERGSLTDAEGLALVLWHISGQTSLADRIIDKWRIT